MNYIKFNDLQCQVISFIKYTNFDENGMTGSCNCQVLTDNVTGLQELGLNPITSLQILHEDEVIYNLQNISAKVTSINEYLADNHIDINLTITF